MLVITTNLQLNTFLNSLHKKESLGLVPTMGALHKGHLSLVEKAIRENQSVMVSIFVNPTQFNNKEDLEKYPNTLEKDIALLSSLSNQITVFAPSVEEVYKNNIVTKKYDFQGLDRVMEGEFRDDHFNGVGTIVELLLNLIKPDNAYFGEKDFQQLQIIKKLTQIQDILVTIIGCPIVREPHGLAMSSRNERLSTKTRNEASFIYETLKTAKEKFGTKSASKVKDWVTKTFLENNTFELEYIEISDIDTLKPIKRKQKGKKYRAFIAVYTENVRLIDNIALN
ncbi:pantothenate synthetase [Maribacter vaceletii]|uniref:Pantothenate synthetase n=1 Tax=Maribacter vaceletii TaxID=1206816 RepID=A0A495EDS1_9FLAO|nr:pantoate--beta-alanine ligase [Maribacter vaceletii]RKR15038.1 pantothenate synthetase [Maribacter vaceletii]